jgi:Restriction endonuclease
LQIRKTKSVVDARNFDNLLQFLDADRDLAGARYEHIRQRLIRLFEWRGVSGPEDLADKTMDRVSRRVSEGLELQSSDPYGYFAGVAHLIYKEELRRQSKSRNVGSLLRYALFPQYESTNDVDSRVREVLDQLSPTDLRLLRQYYQEGGATETKIEEIASDLSASPSSVAQRIKELSNSLVSSAEAETIQGPERKSSVLTLEVIDIGLYRTLVGNPDLLHTLDWRAFERLLADILETFGYEIELHQGTKDGGIDIVAIKREDVFGHHKYILQAKRWTKKVGVEPVRQILFLHDHMRATKSCLATTAKFTKGAWDLSQQYSWQLELRDHSGLYEWIYATAKLKV